MAEVGEVKAIGGDVFQAGALVFDHILDHVSFEFRKPGSSGFRVFQAAVIADIDKAAMPFGE